MLTLGARPLSLDLLVQDYSGHLFPGGFLFAWANTHLAPLDWTLAVVEIVVLQLVASTLAWLVLCRLLPGSWWRLAGAVGLPVLPAGAVAHPVVGGGHPVPPDLHLPVPRDLGLAASAAGGQPLVRPLVVLATAAGLLFQERAVLYPWCSASWPWRSPRRSACAGSSWPSGATSSCGCPSSLLIVGYVMAHRALAPIDSASPGSAAASVELVGNFLARNAVPGLRRGALGGPGSEHHRHPDDLGGGSRLDRPRGGRGPHVVPFPLGCLGLAAAVGLHVGGRRPALRRSDRSGLR